MLWTDKSSFNIGGSRGTIWVTRRPDEEYLEDCLVPKFKKLGSLMVWGAISAGARSPDGRKRLVIWNSAEWGRITSKAYIEYILLPHIAPIIETERFHSCNQIRFYLMEGNAPPHAARYSQNARFTQQIPTLPHGWPANSPDLNPIEVVWRRMKDYFY